MNFLNPLFLSALAAAAIPILIHLFTRRRPREVRFSSLEFLAEVNQSEIRRLRLKQWLLLLLRTLAVAALALAMARPALRGGAGGSAASTLVALVDVSGSMGAPDAAGRPLTDDARRVVESLLATLAPADELLLVPYDRAPRPVSARPLGDAARLRAAAQALAPTASTTDHRAALALAGRALAESHALNRELFWISDFQRAGFADAAAGGAVSEPLRAPPGPWGATRVYLVPLAPRSRANVALARLTPVPAGATSESADSAAEGGLALEVAASAYDANPEGGAATRDVAVEVRALGEDAGAAGADPVLGRGFVSLPARGDGSTLVPLARVPGAGGEVLLPDDALALDNRRVFAAGHAGALHVLLREDGPPSPLRLALAAGAPASGLDLRAVDAVTLARGAGDADLLVIGDVERLGPAELQAVLDFYRGGGGLLLVPGARADAEFWNASLLAETGAGRLGPLETAAPGAAWRLEREVAGHAVLDGFPARPGEPLSAARFQRVRAFAPGARARVLLAFDRAHPALLEAPHALVLATPLDPGSGDFAVSGAFLPLVHQAARTLARGTAAASLAPGDTWRAPAGSGEWRVEDEQGRVVPTTLAGERGAPRLVTPPLERPGLYRVFEGGRLRESFAVNPDPVEGDLAPEPLGEVLNAFPAGRAQVLNAGEDVARRVREARFGRELWPQFVLLALLLLVAETVLGRWGMPGAVTRRAARLP